MLSLRCKVTDAELARIVLYPSRLWRLGEKFGAEWLLWPPPDETQIKRLTELYPYPEPEEGDTIREDLGLVYAPSDMIGTMMMDSLINSTMLVHPANQSVQDERIRFLQQCFTASTMKHILKTLPIGEVARLPRKKLHLEFYDWLKTRRVKEANLLPLFKEFAPDEGEGRYAYTITRLKTAGLIEWLKKEGHKVTYAVK